MLCNSIEELESNYKGAKIINLILAIIGITIALYILLNTSSGCSLVIGIDICNEVHHSKYGSLWGIPLPVYGIALYVQYIVLWTINNKLSLYTLLLGVFVEAYLTYVQVFIIHKLCPLCLLSATVLCTLTFIEFAYWGTRENKSFSSVQYVRILNL